MQWKPVSATEYTNKKGHFYIVSNNFEYFFKKKNVIVIDFILNIWIFCSPNSEKIVWIVRILRL